MKFYSGIKLWTITTLATMSAGGTSMAAGSYAERELETHLLRSSGSTDILLLQPTTNTTTSCNFDEVNSRMRDLEIFTNSSEQCAQAIEDVLASTIEMLTQYCTTRVFFAEKSADIVDGINKIESNLSNNRMIKYIPKVGHIMKKLGVILKRVASNLGKISEADLEKMKTTLSRLENATDILAEVQEFAEEASGFGSIMNFTLSVALDASKANGCCGSDAIHAFGRRYLSKNGLSLATGGFDVCSTMLSIDIPDFPELDLEVLEKVARVVDEIAHWIDAVIGDFSDKVGYHVCCNPWLRPFGMIAEGISDLANLGTCWADGPIDGVINESLDILLPQIQHFSNQVNAGIPAHNHFANLLNGITFDLISINLEQPPELLFDEASCSVNFNGTDMDSSTILTYRPFSIAPLDIVDLEVDGNLDLGSMGKEIVKACKDAQNELLSNEGRDCCIAARWRVGIPENGWEVGHSCNYNGDCNSGHCIDDKCTDFSLGTTCNHDRQCETERCNGGRCQEKLDVCNHCNGDNDCLSGACNLLYGNMGVCAYSNRKVPDSCLCISGRDCLSGRCEGFLPGRHCKAQLPYGSDCNEDNDCSSHNCAKGQCSDGRLGSACDRNTECDSGRCDNHVCQDRLGSCSRCNENTDCQSNQCVFRNFRRVCALSNGKMPDECACDINSQCQSGRCERVHKWWQSYQCEAKAEKGDVCNEDSDCLSGNCKGFWRRICE